jgi:MoaA/NifB/PqqE/SkfB family radical SAM enzyme
MAIREIRHEHQRELIYCDEHEFYRSPKYLEYRKAWNERPRLRDWNEWPVNLDVSVTNACNLSCQMCKRTLAIEDGEAWNSGKLIDPNIMFLDFEIYRRVIDEGAANGLYAVHLTGHDGEPTMHKQLPEMIAYARQKGIIDVFTHSNATLLHLSGRIERILDAEPHRVIFSVDSPVKETYERIRVGAEYEVVVENIRTFVRRKRERGQVFPIVKVQMVVMEQNSGEVDLFKELFRDEIGADVCGFSEFIDYNRIIAGKKAGVAHATRGQEASHYICDYPYRRIRLDQSGYVYACLVGQYHRLGHAGQTTIKEMWHGPILQKLREDHLKSGAGLTPGCTDCGRQWTAENIVAPLEAAVVEVGYQPAQAGAAPEEP